MSSSELQQLYQQIILDHAKYRHGASAEPFGVFDADGAPGLRLAESHQVNTTCGDEITVRVGVRAGSGTAADAAVTDAAGPAPVIEQFVWRGDGCSISMASASVLADTMTGLTVPEAEALVTTFRDLLRSRGTIEPDEEVLGDAAAFAGVSKYPARVKCAMLPWVAFEAALMQVAAASAAAVTPLA
ncbi:SUF system NifU family Fe-S cluster assembly protein [Cryobacterium breve]|uniref:SUF system NifU family Fe-S cluster assembly protein n=1 Tax=Cryobacterium breve TaxID=1259258 RepID=A0ABY7NHS9_9MICO|nr:SUF system NifU family Fe-S cluster assembly protein [Cryobacterium breve]WBM80083.1 SUF system NifU family Fe-S cluster assembly protein [Cryobacterium breve]